MEIRAERGDTVTVHYRLAYENGTLLDDSLKTGPVSFVLGNGFVIQGLEDAVLGMTLGERKTVTIPPHKAYGPKEKDLLLTIPLQAVPAHVELKEGARFEITTDDGVSTKVTLCDITDETVTLDGNLAPAGQSLTLFVELERIS